MASRSLFFLFIVFHSFTSIAQQGKNYFRLVLANNSSYTTTVNILGNDKIDSVRSGQSKDILFDLDDGEVSFYLGLSTSDPSPGSYRGKLIRILNTEKTKQVIITEQGQLKYDLTSDEKIIADVKPGLRTKNFYKLDSVLNKNRNNIAAAEIIYLSLCDIDIKTDTIKKYYELLAPGIRASPFGQRITGYLEARSRLNVGNNLDNFALPATDGKLVELKDIRSDYILLDFWFSRCVPCIQSFPDLKNLYLKTERNKFEILGISVDEKKDNQLWNTTVEKYSLSWININDFKFKLAKSLAIVNYPTKILLNKDRKIILIDTDNSFKNFYQEIEKLVNK